MTNYALKDDAVATFREPAPNEGKAQTVWRNFDACDARLFCVVLQSVAKTLIS
jgi:hypothetical protein